MSEKNQKARCSFALEQIDKIEKIIRRHGGVVPAMGDFEGEMALLMGIAQLGESLGRLDDTLAERFGLLEEKRGAYYTRNYIIHDYENVDRLLIEDILRYHLPELKRKLEALMHFLEKEEE
jgi:uncharacterized protein with HEPN domain